jgi:hypothetical protein
MKRYFGFKEGFMTFGAIFSLSQDFVGQEAYLEHVQNHWTSWKISVPVALVALVLVAVSYFLDVRQAVREREKPREWDGK